MNFQSLGLKPELIRAVTAMGFETPMPIQEQAIPVLMAGSTDFVGLAQTGTGKTGAYGLALLQRLDPTRHTPQVLILCPTRELCMQITGELRQFGRYLKGFKVVAVYGGTMISAQIAEVRHGVQVVVATPGRLCDLMRRKVLDLSGVTIAVLTKLAQRGDIDPGERVVAYITGEGLKTLDCARGTFEAWEIEPTLSSFDQARERVTAAA